MSDPSNDPSGRVASTPKSISRRRYLGYVGAGAGALGLSTANVGALSSDGDIVIDIARDHQGPNPTEVVSEDWYQEAQASRKVQDALLNRFKNASWIGTVGRHATDESGGRDSFDVEIVIGAKDVAAARRAVPDEVDGFSVVVEEFREPEPHSYCNTGNDYCVSGGRFIEFDHVDGGQPNGTATCLVENEHGAERLLTVAHGFYDDCSSDIAGQRLWQGESELYVGYVTDADKNQDWAMIRESAGSDIHGFENDIVGHNGEDVRGAVSRNGIDYLIDHDRETHKYGAKTCHTDGYMVGDDWRYVCGDWRKEGDIDIVAKEGDSGAPHYIKHSGDLYIIGPHGGGHDPEYAPLGYRIENKHGISFGGSDTC